MQRKGRGERRKEDRVREWMAGNPGARKGKDARLNGSSCLG